MEIKKSINILKETIYITENNNDTNIRCEKCLIYSTFDNNEIILCDFCNGAIHQNCYGYPLSEKIPKSQWYCCRCLFIKKSKNKQLINCFICNDVKGILKKYEIENNEDKFAHPFCVSWLPKNFLDIKEKKIVIKLPLNIITNKCSICLQCKGITLKCYNGLKSKEDSDCDSCLSYFHAYCLNKNGLIFTERINNEIFLKEPRLYCLYHLKLYMIKHKVFLENLKEVFKTDGLYEMKREIFEFFSNLKKKLTQSSNKKLKIRKRKFLKLSNNSQIATINNSIQSKQSTALNENESNEKDKNSDDSLIIVKKIKKNEINAENEEIPSINLLFNKNIKISNDNVQIEDLFLKGTDFYQSQLSNKEILFNEEKIFHFPFENETKRKEIKNHLLKNQIANIDSLSDNNFYLFDTNNKTINIDGNLKMISEETVKIKNIDEIQNYSNECIYLEENIKKSLDFLRITKFQNENEQISDNDIADKKFLLKTHCNKKFYFKNNFNFNSNLNY